MGLPTAKKKLDWPQKIIVLLKDLGLPRYHVSNNVHVSYLRKSHMFCLRHISPYVNMRAVEIISLMYFCVSIKHKFLRATHCEVTVTYLFYWGQLCETGMVFMQKWHSKKREGEKRYRLLASVNDCIEDYSIVRQHNKKLFTTLKQNKPAAPLT